MLYLDYVLLRYVLIYNLEVFLNFLLTFLQLNVIKTFTVKTLFSLLPAIFFQLPITRTPDNSNSISLEGSSYRESTVPTTLSRAILQG